MKLSKVDITYYMLLVFMILALVVLAFTGDSATKARKMAQAGGAEQQSINLMKQWEIMVWVIFGVLLAVMLTGMGFWTAVVMRKKAAGYGMRYARYS